MDMSWVSQVRAVGSYQAQQGRDDGRSGNVHLCAYARMPNMNTDWNKLVSRSFDYIRTVNIQNVHVRAYLITHKQVTHLLTTVDHNHTRKFINENMHVQVA